MEKAIREYQEARLEAAIMASKMIMASAITAPRVGGIDEVTIHRIDDRDAIDEMAIFVDKMADDNPAWDFFHSDAVQIADSDAVMILADRRSGIDPMHSNCNLCGHTLCDWFSDVPKLDAAPNLAFQGPFCLLRSMNMAYALNGAVSQARNLGVDHMVKMSVGAAGVRMGLVPYKAGIALGLLLSVTEKNPFRDLPKQYAEYNASTLENRLIGRIFPTFRSIYS